MGSDDVEHHQERSVGGGHIEHGHVVETEKRGVVLIGDITFRTATYTLAGQELIRNSLIKMRQRGKLRPGRESVGHAFTDKGEIRDSFHRRIGYQIV